MPDSAETQRQLSLPFAHRPEFAAADFVEAPSNAAALAWLDRTESWPEGRLAIWGEPGCGKTHLLRIWAERHQAIWSDGASLHAVPPPSPALVIDNADNSPDEAVMLHTLNQAAANGGSVLISGRQAPARWQLRLSDLMSRLRATTAVEIASPDDFLLRALLARLMADRQLSVPSPVRDWILVRLPRSAAAIRDAVARLDRAQLEAGRRVTRALASAIIAEMEKEVG